MSDIRLGRTRTGSDETSPILCGTCHVSPRAGFERDGETWSSCPSCGAEDRVVDIQREALAYHADKSRRDMFPDTDGAGGEPPSLAYRWITGD